MLQIITAVLKADIMEGTRSKQSINEKITNDEWIRKVAQVVADSARKKAQKS